MKRAPGVAAAAVAAALAISGTGSASQPRLVPGLALFAGTTEGLWRSGDWGKSWERLAGGTGGSTLDGLGAVGEGAHASHESVVLAEIARRTALLALLIAGIGW